MRRAALAVALAAALLAAPAARAQLRQTALSQLFSSNLLSALVNSLSPAVTRFSGGGSLVPDCAPRAFRLPPGYIRLPRLGRRGDAADQFTGAPPAGRRLFRARLLQLVLLPSGEFSCVLGRPVEAENILEANQPTNQPTNSPLTHNRPLPKLKFQVMEQFNGRLSYGPSWYDLYASVTSRRSPVMGSAWIITYDEVTPGGAGGTGAAGLLGALLPQGAGDALGAVAGLYANLVASSRDEMRLIAPGAVLGQVFFRPRSPSNPLPLPVASGIRFALFQVCAKGGGYAYGGNQRYLGPALPAPAPAAG